MQSNDSPGLEINRFGPHAASVYPGDEKKNIDLLCNLSSPHARRIGGDRHGKTALGPGPRKPCTTFSFVYPDCQAVGTKPGRGRISHHLGTGELQPSGDKGELPADSPECQISTPQIVSAPLPRQAPSGIQRGLSTERLYFCMGAHGGVTDACGVGLRSALESGTVDKGRARHKKGGPNIYYGLGRICTFVCGPWALLKLASSPAKYPPTFTDMLCSVVLPSL